MKSRCLSSALPVFPRQSAQAHSWCDFWQIIKRKASKQGEHKQTEDPYFRHYSAYTP